MSIANQCYRITSNNLLHFSSARIATCHASLVPICIGQVHTQKQSAHYTMIIDCVASGPLSKFNVSKRDCLLFQHNHKGHIQGAIHLTSQTRLRRYWKNGGLAPWLTSQCMFAFLPHDLWADPPQFHDINCLKRSYSVEWAIISKSGLWVGGGLSCMVRLVTASVAPLPIRILLKLVTIFKTGYHFPSRIWLFCFMKHVKQSGIPYQKHE